MVPIPVHFGEAYTSVMAVMLFPDDERKAKWFVAHRLAKGALQEYEAAGHDFSDRHREYLDTVGDSPVSDAEVNKRYYDGSLVGETVKVLWALICDGDARAGWNAAIKTVESGNGSNPASGSRIRKQLKRFAPVLHLWGVWAVRGQDFGPSDEMLSDANWLLVALRQWQDSRPENWKSDKSYLVGEEFGPWPGWAGQREFRLPTIGLLPQQLADLKPTGRPRK
jgi:hypothetical protein